MTLGKVPAEPETDDENPPLTIPLRLHTIARRWISARGGGREVSEPVTPSAVDVEDWRYYFSEGCVSLVLFVCSFCSCSCCDLYGRERGREEGAMGRWGDGEKGRWGDVEMWRWGDVEMGRWGDIRTAL